MSREERLKNIGWTEPIYESPFNLPSDWKDGGVEATGGGTTSRIWRHKNEDLEVIYNLEDDMVGVVDTEGKGFDQVKTLYAEDSTDEALAERARQYIQSY